MRRSSSRHTVDTSARPLHTARAATLALATALIGATACGPVSPTQKADESVGAEETAVTTCPTTVDPLRTQEIVHPNVTDDARASNATVGPWSLGGLVRKLAPSSSQANVDAFFRNIFESWLADQVVNGETVPARPAVDGNIMGQFVVTGSNPRSFDLTRTPFELIAIANRLDLRSATDAGELRFIYGLTNPPAARQRFGRFQFMTLIVEYKVPFVAGLDTAAKWADRWHELDAVDPATSAALFNSKLQAITDIVTAHPSGTPAARIRTNEIAIGSPWELREFNFGPLGFMVPATTKNSPNHGTINDSPALLDFIARNPLLETTSDTSFLSVDMPAIFEGGSFLGGRSLENFSESRWTLGNGETQDNSVRVDNFGLLTCNGCHNENKNPGDVAFYQVVPVAATQNPITGVNDGTGRLSRFMLNGDPTKGARRPAELSRRAADFQLLLCPPAGTPDLVVTSATWSPANLVPGQPATFTATVRNRGTAPTAQGTVVGVAFNVDGTLVNWSDTDRQSLSPGASVTLTANGGPSGTSTWNATFGAHTLQAWVDDVNRTGESDEGNNKLSVPFGVGPDLVVTSVAFAPQSASPGTPLTFSATVKNIGTVATPAGTVVGVGFRVDGNLATWSDTNSQSLAPGASVTLSANGGPTGSPTWNAVSGAHSLEAWVDDVNRVGEGNEANNKLVVPLSIGIDLVVTSAAPSGSNISVGTQVSFVATVKNVGTIATPPGVIVGVAFQVDGTLVSWSDSDTQSLAPGASINLLVNSGPSGVAFWTATSGTHSVQAWVDDVNRMNDVNRSNNKRTFSLIVQ